MAADSTMDHDMADLGDLELPSNQCLGRKIKPEDAIYAFNYEEIYRPLALEEELQFAIAFKETPKDFGRIAERLPGRTRGECIKHYYHNKHDGRFKTSTWEETNTKHKRKKFATLKEDDRRMHGLPSTNGVLENPGIRAEREEIARRMKLLPINEEIKRLLDLIPNATAVHADALVTAQKAQDAARDAEANLEMPQNENKRGTRSGATLSNVKPFEELRDIIESTTTEVAGIVKHLKMSRNEALEAEAKYEDGDVMSEINMRQWRGFHKLYLREVEWLDDAMYVLLRGSGKINEPDNDLASGDLFTGLTSLRYGMVRLEEHKLKLQAQVSRAGKRGGVEKDQVKPLQEALVGREAQLAQLRGLVQALKASTSKALAEENREEEQQGDDDADAEDDGDSSDGKDGGEFSGEGEIYMSDDETDDESWA